MTLEEMLADAKTELEQAVAKSDAAAPDLAEKLTKAADTLEKSMGNPESGAPPKKGKAKEGAPDSSDGDADDGGEDDAMDAADAMDNDNGDEEAPGDKKPVAYEKGPPEKGKTKIAKSQAQHTEQMIRDLAQGEGAAQHADTVEAAPALEHFETSLIKSLAKREAQIDAVVSRLTAQVEALTGIVTEQATLIKSMAPITAMLAKSEAQRQNLAKSMAGAVSSLARPVSDGVMFVAANGDTTATPATLEKSRVRQMFREAAENEIIHPDVLARLDVLPLDEIIKSLTPDQKKAMKLA